MTINITFSCLIQTIITCNETLNVIPDLNKYVNAFIHTNDYIECDTENFSRRGK